LFKKVNSNNPRQYNAHLQRENKHTHDNHRP
jgi:hypothetical protein